MWKTLPPTKFAAMTSLRFLIVLSARAAAVQVNPVSQMIGLLQDFHTRVTADADAEVEAFEAYTACCAEKVKDETFLLTLKWHERIFFEVDGKS